MQNFKILLMKNALKVMLTSLSGLQEHIWQGKKAVGVRQ